MTLKAPIGNVGQMTNTIVDITINTNNINKSDFTWKTTFFITIIKTGWINSSNESVSSMVKVYYDGYLITKHCRYSRGFFLGFENRWFIPHNNSTTLPTATRSLDCRYLKAVPVAGWYPFQRPEWRPEIDDKDYTYIEARCQNSLGLTTILLTKLWCHHFCRAAMVPKFSTSALAAGIYDRRL